MAEQLLEHEAMMRKKLALQRQFQLRNLRTHAATRGLCQTGGVFLAVDQSVQDLTPGNAQDIAGHNSQFEVGVLQELVDAIGGACVFAFELRAMPGQIPQLALTPRRHKAAAQ
jgi:hypothetical protein